MDSKSRAYLLDFLIERFNLSELKNIAFILATDYEQFEHTTKIDFVRELILHFERRNSLSCLVEAILDKRYDLILRDIYAELTSCQPRKKASIFIPSGHDYSIDELAKAIRLQPDEISIIATARGSLRFLIGLSETSLVNIENRNRANLQRNVNIQRFEELDLFDQKIWETTAQDWTPVTQNGKLIPRISWAEVRKQTFLSILDNRYLDSSENFKTDISATAPLPISHLPLVTNHDLSTQYDQETVSDEFDTLPNILVESPIPQHINQSDSLIWYHVADREEFEDFLPTILADTVLLVDTRTDLYTCDEGDLVIVKQADAKGSIPLQPQEEVEERPLTRVYLAEVDEQFSFERDPETGEIHFKSDKPEEVRKIKITAKQADFPTFAEEIIGIVIGIWVNMYPVQK